MIILLIGFMGSGKSSVGKELAKQLGYKFIEFDELVLKNTGFKTIPEVYQERISLWKECELETSKDLSLEKNLIIACGGGLIDNDLNLIYFKERSPDLKIIYLKAEPEVISKRLEKELAHKKINYQNTLEKIKKLLPKRHLLYTEQADLVVDTNEKELKTICEEITNNIFNNLDTSTLPIYQKLLLLAINQDGGFYPQALAKLNFVLIESILLELLLEKKIKILANGVEVLDPWYVPSDEIIRSVLHNITTPPNQNRLGTELQKLCTLDYQEISDRALDYLVEKNFLRLEKTQYLFFKTLESYEVILPLRLENILQGILKLAQKNNKSTFKDTLTFYLLDRLKIAETILGSEEAEKIRKIVKVTIENELIYSPLKQLTEESQWAANYFSYNP